MSIGFLQFGELVLTVSHHLSERLRGSGGSWDQLLDMPIELTGHRAIAVGSDLYVVGGFRSANGVRQGFTGVPFVWRYQPP